MTDFNNLTDADFDEWLRRQADDMAIPDDELLAETVSKAIREDMPEAKAQWLLDVANLCMAMAERALGCQAPIVTCLTLTRH
ncbi:hypothetical protein [Herbaspirillum sp. SJZ107]|uniref:hypothetical protein n=1 Tax=Herbaspirillum sp. SJZ107 TaxID=2572881 RepID=UPI00114FCB12|nr:hypothetical protein [Herbaspirillum sp. SJZ107]TQK01258.1 hypothetical protein FBX97_5787 [Herbaspirillum sp. SJZ107]